MHGMRNPSHEEILRVHKYECSIRDHTWEIISTLGVGPVSLVCSHCGEYLDVDNPRKHEIP